MLGNKYRSNFTNLFNETKFVVTLISPFGLITGRMLFIHVDFDFCIYFFSTSFSIALSIPAYSFFGKLYILSMTLLPGSVFISPSHNRSLNFLTWSSKIFLQLNFSSNFRKYMEFYPIIYVFIFHIYLVCSNIRILHLNM
jgi:hypothetical protein